MLGTPTIRRPPGASRSRMLPRVARGSGTCSSTWDMRTTSHGPSGRPPSCSRASSDPFSTHRLPRDRATSTARADGSTPQASCPASRKAITAPPVPAPTSSTVMPGRIGPPVSASGIATPSARATRPPDCPARASAVRDARAVIDSPEPCWGYSSGYQAPGSSGHGSVRHRRHDAHSTTRNSPGMPRRWSRAVSTVAPPVMPQIGHDDGWVSEIPGMAGGYGPESTSLAGT